MKRFRSTLLTSAALALLSTSLPTHGGECCLVNEHQDFTPTTAGANYFFGSSLSISAMRLVAGAPGGGPSGAPTAGLAYVYDLDDELWVEDESISAAVPANGDDFGASVDIDGDRIVVGAPSEETAPLVNAGAAYIFKPQSNVWQEEQKLTASDADSSDNFGFAVAISGVVAVVGAPNDSHSSLTAPGSVYVFRNNGSGVWSQEAKLVASSPGPNYDFGRAVAIDGNTIAVGEPEASSDTGRVTIFTYSGSTWSQQQALTLSPLGNYEFGFSVSLRGDVIVIGAPGVDRVYVYRRSNGTWDLEDVVQHCDDAPNVDRFGESVSIDGTLIVVGAPENDNDGINSGSAHVFRKTGNQWNEISKLFPCNGGGGDGFGKAVFMDQGVSVVGAPRAEVSTTTNQGKSFNYDGFAPCECLGNLNGDSAINGTDLAILLAAWGACSGSCPEDLNGTGIVDGMDLAILLGSWGRCPGSEPCPDPFGGGESSFGGGDEGEPTEDEVAQLLGFQDAASFYAWLKTADVDDVQAAGLTLQELIGG